MKGITKTNPTEHLTPVGGEGTVDGCHKEEKKEEKKTQRSNEQKSDRI